MGFEWVEEKVLKAASVKIGSWGDFKKLAISVKKRFGTGRCTESKAGAWSTKG